MRKVLLAVLLLAGPVFAGDLTIAGEKKVPKNSFAELYVEGNTNVAWMVYPAPVKLVNRGGYLYFSGVEGIGYVVMGTSVDFDKRKMDSGTAIVTFGEGPAPPIPPGPGPTPGPTDPFVADLTAAFAKETTDRPYLSQLTDFYKVAQTKVDGATTWVGLFTDLVQLATEKGLIGKLNGVQLVIQKKLQSKFPYKDVLPEQPVDRALAKATFQEVASALEKVK